jgi:hypothetical protein
MFFKHLFSSMNKARKATGVNGIKQDDDIDIALNALTYLLHWWSKKIIQTQTGISAVELALLVEHKKALPVNKLKKLIHFYCNTRNKTELKTTRHQYLIVVKKHRSFFKEEFFSC